MLEQFVLWELNLEFIRDGYKMGNYYLFSDFSEENGFSLVADEFKKDIKNYNQIVFIASCPTIGEKTDKYVERYLEWFHRIGIQFKSKVVLDDRIDSIQMINAIKNASLIFLMGGTTPSQMKFLLENQLVEEICKVDCLIMGLSAGSINMAKTSILTITCGNDEQEIYNGIGLVDKSIEPHFVLSNFNDELKKLSYKYLIYGLCDESAIIIRHNECSYYGNIYLLKGGNYEKVCC